MTAWLGTVRRRDDKLPPEGPSGANDLPLRLAGLAAGRTLAVIGFLDLSLRLGHDG